MFDAFCSGMALTHKWLAVGSLMLALGGCVAAMPTRGDQEIDDGADETVVSADSPADDPYGYHDYTYVANSILEVANTVDEQELIDGARINERAARAIGEWQAAGHRFVFLEQLDSLPGTGRSFFNRMRDYAASHGFLGHCGDALVQRGVESCDDSNTVSFDGCSASCALEPAEPCHGMTPVCGDGLVCPAEACDDGNTASNDGCSAACDIVETYSSEAQYTSFATALDVPATYRKVASTLTRGETQYFTVHALADTIVRIWQDGNCGYEFAVESVTSDGRVLARDDSTGIGQCGYLDLRPGTYTIAVRGYWAGTIYEDESNGFGDYVLSIDPLPAWLQ
jgi:cysteine-rich repeat protein